MIKTVTQLIQEQNDLLIQLENIRNQMRQNPYHSEIEIIRSSFSFEREAMQLAEFIVQRDNPMTHKEIEQVFKTSGFEYTQDDVLACYPDSDEFTRQYNAEMQADYNSIYG